VIYCSVVKNIKDRGRITNNNETTESTDKIAYVVRNDPLRVVQAGMTLYLKEKYFTGTLETPLKTTRKLR